MYKKGEVISSERKESQNGRITKMLFYACG
jgi:hypothetical protein